MPEIMHNVRQVQEAVPGQDALMSSRYHHRPSQNGPKVGVRSYATPIGAEHLRADRRAVRAR